MKIKRIIFFVVIIIICIISVIVGIYAQFMYRYEDTGNLLFGNILEEPEYDSTYDDLRDSFNDIFNNKLNSYTTTSTINKVDTNKEIVYTETDFVKTETGKYEINVKIPTINIDSTTAQSLNDKIQKSIKENVNNIMAQENINTKYMVDYVAYINGDVLSVVVRINSKEGNNAQRTYIKTYNYNLTSNKEITLQEILSLKGITLVEANDTIKKEIKKINERAEGLVSAGFTVYTRNVNDPMYNVNNTYNYFIGQEQYLYIVYAYGNDRYTTEIDLVIF